MKKPDVLFDVGRMNVICKIDSVSFPAVQRWQELEIKRLDLIVEALLKDLVVRWLVNVNRRFTINNLGRIHSCVNDVLHVGDMFRAACGCYAVVGHFIFMTVKRDSYF